ncbi:ShlB/FhaC/HecB family hemolysin secretion/activation protein [Leptothoe sp. EHU-05/26/07-4]
MNRQISFSIRQFYQDSPKPFKGGFTLLYLALFLAISSNSLAKAQSYNNEAEDLPSVQTEARFLLPPDSVSLELFENQVITELDFGSLDYIETEATYTGNTDYKSVSQFSLSQLDLEENSNSTDLGQLTLEENSNSTDLEENSTGSDLSENSFVCSQGTKIDIGNISADEIISYEADGSFGSDELVDEPREASTPYETILIRDYCFSQRSLYTRRDTRRDREFVANLDAILTPYLGQTVLPEQIKGIQDKITLQYLTSGYVTSRAGAVDVRSDGTLFIHVIEGFIQDVRVSSQRSTEYRYEDEISTEMSVANSEVFAEESHQSEGESKIEGLGERTPLGQYIRAHLRPATGDLEDPYDQRPVNISDLEDYVRLLSLDPRFENDLTLSVLRAPRKTWGEDTSTPGASVLDIEVQQIISELSLSLNNYAPPSLGDVGFDWGAIYNSDNGTTLATRGRYSIEGDSPSFSFDSDDDDFLGDDILTSWLADYTSPPIGSSLGRINIQAARDQKDVVQGDFSSFGFRSETERYSINYRHPLRRTLAQEFALEVGFTFEEGKTFVGETLPFRVGFGPDESGISKTSTLSFAQEYIQRGRNNLFLLRSQFNLGIGVFDATDNPSPIPDGQFFSWNGQAQLLKPISENHTLFARAVAQVASDSLLPINQFVMGGGQSVRGYRENFRAGDNGVVLSVEDRINIFINGEQSWLDLKLIPFFDAGWVWNNNGNPNQTLDPDFIASVGIGLQANLLESKNLRLRLDYGIPLSGAGDAGDDLQDQRFHFSINYTQPIY